MLRARTSRKDALVRVEAEACLASCPVETLEGGRNFVLGPNEANIIRSSGSFSARATAPEGRLNSYRSSSRQPNCLTLKLACCSSRIVLLGANSAFPLGSPRPPPSPKPGPTSTVRSATVSSLCALDPYHQTPGCRPRPAVFWTTSIEKGKGEAYAVQVDVRCNDRNRIINDKRVLIATIHFQSVARQSMDGIYGREPTVWQLLKSPHWRLSGSQSCSCLSAITGRPWRTVERTSSCSQQLETPRTASGPTGTQSSW